MDWKSTGFASALVAVLTIATKPCAGADRGKYEFTPAPILGGSSDVGVGGGVLASLARRQPGTEPYAYRLELATTTTYKASGRERIPYQDYYLLLQVPHAFAQRTKLEFRVSYTRETNLKYYGLGNASRLAPGTSLDDPAYEYVRTHPEVQAYARQNLWGPLNDELTIHFVYNQVSVPANTVLARDLESPSPEVRNLVHVTPEHATLTFGYGLIADTRDNEVATNKGQYYSLRLDLSPGGAGLFPYRYGRVNTSFRWYLPLQPEGSTVGLKLTTDFLFGNEPVYELARFENTSALGGANGVRGVPAERYHGRIKVLSNLEWRQVLFRFDLLGKSNAFALALFLDSGRVWTNYRQVSELDGSGVGLKVGTGIGAHIIAGKSFVIRADVAWSPVARPVGAYVASGEIF